MNMQEVRLMAKKYGINSFGKSKENIIREIQTAEGNFACFGSALDYCDQVQCCFRSICLNGNGNKAKSKKQNPFLTAGGEPVYYNTKYLMARYPF